MADGLSENLVRRLDLWRERLIDLSRRNALISWKPPRTAHLRILQPSAAEVWVRHQHEGTNWEFRLPAEKAGENAEPSDREENELVPEELDRAELQRVLTALYRRAKSDLQERGVRVLHLVFGTLHWFDPPNQPALISPILLVPVALERPTLRDPLQLVPIDAEPFLNPALTVRLQKEFGLTLPPIPNGDTESFEKFFADLTARISEREGWHIEPLMALTLLSFEKAVMQQDLTENLAEAARHPLLQALAGEPIDLRTAEAPASETVGEPSLILDADATQRHALSVARSGRSFVLFGPPGTGKSQTIANLIADRLALGGTVLFVSEKMAALEVVSRRLQQAGLGDLCLEVHGVQAERARVVGELYRTLVGLDNRPRKPTASANERRELLRRRLNDIAAAEERIREPLGLSLRSAYDEIAALADLPTLPFRAPTQERDLEWFRSAVRALEDMALLQPLAEEGEAGLWRGLRAKAFSLGLREELRAALDTAGKAVTELRSALRDLRDALEATEPLEQLVHIADILAASPNPPPRWLTEEEPATLLADIDRLRETAEHFRRERLALLERYGPAVWNLPTDQTNAVRSASAALERLLGPQALGAEVLARRRELSEWAADLQKYAERRRSDAEQLATFVGLPWTETTPRRLRWLLDLLAGLGRSKPPEQGWFEKPTFERIQTFIDSIRRELTATAAERAELRKRWHDRLYTLDLDRLAEKFAGTYRRVWSSLLPSYYRDQATLTAVALTPELPIRCADDLAIAARLQQRMRAILASADGLRPLLGRHAEAATGDPSALEAAENALTVVRSTFQLLDWLGCATIPTKLSELIAQGATLPPHLDVLRQRLSDSLGQWLTLTTSLKNLLPVTGLPNIATPLLDTPLDRLGEFADEIRSKLGTLENALLPILLEPIPRPRSLQSLLDDLKQMDLIRAWQQADAAEEPRRRERFGRFYRDSFSTDWQQLRTAAEWTVKVRQAYAGKVPGSAFVRLACREGTAAVVEQFRTAYRTEREAWAGVAAFFQPTRFPTPLSPSAHEDFLTKATARLDELPDWFRLAQLPRELEALDLTAFTTLLREFAVPTERIPDLFRKAFLTAWVDEVRAGDPALAEVDRLQIEHLAEEFRELDRAAMPIHAQQIVARVRERLPGRPQPIPGSEVETLYKQAMLRSRGRPLRQVFAEMPTLLQRLKPCLLMSPLSVSQFLTSPLLRFDLVLFDEASQIPPEDALTSLYRGKQVIVVGDDKQLPPTTFFQTGERDDEDDAGYPSILDQCKTVLPCFALRWHYRSRAESLIAFSNQAFYGGELVTFPGADQGSSERGVFFHHVPDGIYERGGRRQNRREAEVVTDLLFQQLERDPSKSIGVIAFSQAQMNAIEDQIELRRSRDGRFEEAFRDDRAEPIFVRNLETVQGDERDIIFLSLGYGRDEKGKPSLNFGPLNRVGGEKRLNVAVTRARDKLTVVSSLRAIDLAGRQAAPEGFLHLRRFLEYAELGGRPPPHDARPSVAAAPLRASVAAAVQARGYAVECGLGTGAGRIDVAVRRPESGFLLGILIEPGANLPPDAVDRERLRPQVLTKLGWRLHRLRAFDWLARRDREIDRLLTALAHATSAPLLLERPIISPLPRPVELLPQAAAELPDVKDLPGTIPYPLAEVRWTGTRDEFVAEKSRPALREILEKIVAVEGPIHEELLAKRLPQVAGIERVTEKVRAAVAAVLADIGRSSSIVRQGEFLRPKEQTVVPIRTPIPGDERTLRSFGQIPRAEWREGILLIARLGVGMEPVQLCKQSARLFGLRLSDALRGMLEGLIETMIADGLLIRRGELLGTGPNTRGGDCQEEGGRIRSATGDHPLGDRQ